MEYDIYPKLQTLQMVDCNKITDFSSLKNANIKELRLMGCNGLSSFTSKLMIDDLSNIFNMKNLQSLALDIVKNYDVLEFLKSLAKLKNLKVLYIPDNSLTFEQFAWLKSKLPDTEGLEGVRYFSLSGVVDSNETVLEYYSIIGKRRPRCLSVDKIDRVNKYKNDYNKLVEIYVNEIEPPE